MMLAPRSGLEVARASLRPFWELALPMAIGQLGQMGMILIDMFMVGKLGPAAIAGLGLGSSIVYLFALFGAGTLFGLDYLVASATGRNDVAEGHHWLWQGLYLSLCMSIPFVLLLELAAPGLMRLWFAPDVSGPAVAFLQSLSLSLPSFLLFVTIRQYLQATGSAPSGSVVTLAAIGSNICFNWLFIYGHAGLPAWGVAGAGVATTLTRTLMALALGGFMLWRDRRLALGLLASAKRPVAASLARLFKLGAPTGLHMALEIAAFSLVAFLIGHLGYLPAASHTLVSNVAGFTYTVPVAMSGAAAILVGQAHGAQRHGEVRASGWMAIAAGASVMAGLGLLLAAFGAHVAGVFTQDSAVIMLSTRLIALVALFQVADGVQMVGGGALRGLGNTRSILWANLVGYWIIGLPLGYYLGIERGLGAYGFWIGLTVGLFAVAAFVLQQWVALTRPPKQATASAEALASLEPSRDPPVSHQSH